MVRTFAMSGILEDRIQYSTNAGDGLTDNRRWIIEEEAGAGKELEVHEVVILMNIPAPGQTANAMNGLASIYSKIVRASMWISASGSFNFSMPIPHYGSGMSDPRLNGQWTMWYDGNVGMQIHASEDAFDFTNPGDSYQCYGIVEYINI